MIMITPKTTLTLQDMKRQYEFVRAVRDAKNNDYMISRTLEDAPALVILAKDDFDQMISSVDASLALSPKWKSMMIDMPSASLRAEEMYHLILGQPTYTVDAQDHTQGENQALDKKVLVKGTQLDLQVENVVAASGGVQAAFPIADYLSVSARKAAGDLQVASIASLKKGAVALTDAGAPVADAVAVELVYATKEHLVVYLNDQFKKTVGVLCSKELNDYLVANA